MRLTYVLLLLSAFSLDATGQSSQSPPPKPPPQEQEISPDDVVRVDTTLVGVPVTVLDRQGRLVPNLKQEDFRLYEDGVEQQIAHFAPVDVPVTVLLLFDDRLLSSKLVSNFHELAMAFANQMRAGDRVLVTKFGATNFEVLSKTSDNSASVQKEPRKVKWHFGPSIHDAVDAAIRYMNGIPGRKAIVLFADGLLPSVIEVTEMSGRIISQTETKPREKVTPQHTLNEAEESDAPIYVLQYDTMTDVVRNGPQPGTRYWDQRDWFAARRNEYRIADQYLHALAEKSGARLYPAGKPPDVSPAFTQISAELSQQYSLGYYPKVQGQPGDHREIRVRVQKPDLVVRSRTTYVYTPRKQK